MADKRKLIVEVIGDASSLQKAFGKAEQSGSRFSRTMGKVGKAAAFTAGGVAFGGLVVGLKRGVDEFNETQKVSAQTAAVLKSTGKAAGVSAKHVGALATKLSLMSGIDDEVIQAQENMLLAFKGVRNEAGKGNKIFDRATKVILDYSVRTGKDASGAAVLFGKALNEIAQGQIPKSIRGLGKLSEATQKEIKAHVDAGDAAGAQAVLLEQLEKRYGGAAKAGGDTFAGSLNKVKNSFDEVAGSIVAGAAPALQKYADRISKWLSKAENQRKIQEAVNRFMRIAGEIIRSVTGFIKTMIPIVQRVVDLFGGWKNVIIAIIALKFATKILAMTKAFSALAGAGGIGGVVQKIGGKGGLLSLLKSLRASAAIPILFSIGFSIGQIGEKSTTAGSVPGGPQDIQKGPGMLTAYFDPIDGESHLVQVRKGETDTQAAIRDFERRHPRGRGAGKRGGGRPTVPGGARRTAAAFSSGVGFVSPSRTLAAMPVGTAAARGVVINGPVTVVANDPNELVRNLQKRSLRTSPSRAGRFGGHNLGLT